MIASIDHNVLNLVVATLLGGAIGFERQWRQRMAGLRTNTLLLQGTGNGHLSPRQLDSTDLEGHDRVEVNARLTAQSKSDALLEQIVGRLSLESTVSAASWRVEPLVE